MSSRKNDDNNFSRLFGNDKIIEFYDDDINKNKFKLIKYVYF